MLTSQAALPTRRATERWKEQFRLPKKIAKKPEDPYLAFLSHRSTPPENGYTPTELLLMGRKIRSTLSMSPEKLIPKLPNLKRLQKTERNPDNYKLITTTYVIERQSSLT